VDLCLEIVEGAGAGTLIPLDRPLVIGRDPDVDFPLRDTQASRRHVLVAPENGDAVLEDLGSTNGTFVDNNEVHGRQRIAAGAELLIGVTVIQLRTSHDVERQASAARPVPPPLAIAGTPPAYVDPGTAVDTATIPSLERLRDARTKSMAKLAPLAILVVAALAVIIYLGLS
jgi:pSer/pThr/pTyr-binding forkhead associated (FHA) protein